MDDEILKRLMVTVILTVIAGIVIYGMWIVCNYVMQTIVKGIIFIVFVLGVAI